MTFQDKAKEILADAIIHIDNERKPSIIDDETMAQLTAAYEAALLEELEAIYGNPNDFSDDKTIRRLIERIAELKGQDK